MADQAPSSGFSLAAALHAAQNGDNSGAMGQLRGTVGLPVSKQLPGKPAVPVPDAAGWPTLGGTINTLAKMAAAPQSYEQHPAVVALSDPNFARDFIGSFAVRPSIPDNANAVPDAFRPVNQKYGINKQWTEAPAVEGTSLYDRLVKNPTAFAASTLNPNPMKNPLTNPNPLKNSLTNPNPLDNIITNPLKIFGI